VPLKSAIAMAFDSQPVRTPTGVRGVLTHLQCRTRTSAAPYMAVFYRVAVRQRRRPGGGNYEIVRRSTEKLVTRRSFL
jgi:hypothetical protein